jgi:starch synthase
LVSGLAGAVRSRRSTACSALSEAAFAPLRITAGSRAARCVTAGRGARETTTAAVSAAASPGGGTASLTGVAAHASYMDEIRGNANGLEKLFGFEQGKSSGILNGIDTQVWDPHTDSYIIKNYDREEVEKGKRKNKKELAGKFGLDPDKPLISFIGRLVGEKSADLLPEAISQSIYRHHGQANFLVLGSGDPNLEDRLDQMKHQLGGFYNSFIGYDEGLSHLIYAGSDFLLMPSRVEPCGLNQMYALRYGTVPMVRSVGGLKDTVKDMGEWQGFGIRFDQANVNDITYSVGRAIDLYTNKPDLYSWMKKYMMTIDHSWDQSAQQYIDLYTSLIS